MNLPLEIEMMAYEDGNRSSTATQGAFFLRAPENLAPTFDRR
jgi:hypothetical protein